MESTWIERLPWQDILVVAERLGVFGLGAGAITLLLNRWAHREQVRFSVLHAKRAEVLGEGYRLIAVAERALELAADIQPDAREAHDRLATFGEAAQAFRDYAQDHRVWFPRESCAELDRYWQELKRAGYAVMDWRRPRSSRTWDDVVVATRETLPKVREQLEAHFRQLLGGHS